MKKIGTDEYYTALATIKNLNVVITFKGLTFIHQNRILNSEYHLKQLIFERNIDKPTKYTEEVISILKLIAPRLYIPEFDLTLEAIKEEVEKAS